MLRNKHDGLPVRGFVTCAPPQNENDSIILYAGTPAKKVKDVSPEQTRDMIERIANNYLMYAGWYKE